MATQLVQAAPAYSLVDSEGNSIATFSAEAIQGLLGGAMQRHGGGSPLATIGDAVDGGVSLLQAISIQNDVDDSREAMDRLYSARARLYKGLQAALPNPVQVDGRPVTIRELVRDVDIQQDKVDRAQNRAFSKGITVLWAHAFGGASRIVGRMQDSMSGLLSGGESPWGVGLLGAGIGAVFASLFTGGGRRRRLDDEDDDISNVPA